MERVAIIGVGGAGKSTLAVALGARTGLPVVHLDRLFWKPGWRASERAEFVAAQERALPVGGRWIADGNYGGTMPFRLARADTIVLLDLSPALCVARVLARAWRTRGRVRADMPEGCPERFWDPSYLEFLWWVLRYRAVHRPRVLDKIAAHGAQARLVILRTPAEVAGFLISLR